MVTEKCDRELCEEIIMWAKFLVEHGVNPMFVPKSEYCKLEDWSAEDD